MVEQSAILVAMSPEGVIGRGGRIPWHYSGDLRRLKRLTLGTTVILGRGTWESIGCRPLPRRRNLVISSRPAEGVETFPDIPSALAASEGFVWYLGGARIYAEAMRYCDFLDVTYVPDHQDPVGAVLFPAIDPAIFCAEPLEPHEDEPTLQHRIFRRKGPAGSRGL